MKEPFWSEVYEVKTQNTRYRIHTGGKCDECGARQGHKETCSQVTLEDVVFLLRLAQKREDNMRIKAARWLEHLQRVTGKLAILRHENNKLRNANDRLKREAAAEKAKGAGQ